MENWKNRNNAELIEYGLRRRRASRHLSRAMHHLKNATYENSPLWSRIVLRWVDYVRIHFTGRPPANWRRAA